MGNIRLDPRPPKGERGVDSEDCGGGGKTLAPEARRDYQRNVEPFVGPLRATLLTSDTQEGMISFTIILTIQ